MRYQAALRPVPSIGLGLMGFLPPKSKRKIGTMANKRDMEEGTSRNCTGEILSIQSASSRSRPRTARADCTGRNDKSRWCPRLGHITTILTTLRRHLFLLDQAYKNWECIVLDDASDVGILSSAYSNQRSRPSPLTKAMSATVSVLASSGEGSNSCTSRFRPTRVFTLT